MKNKSFYLVSVIAMLSFYGCSNDSGESSSPSEKECTAGSECSSGKCLDDGTCAPLVNDGENCDDTHLCKDGLECISGTCKTKDPEPPKEECKIDSDCDGDLVCESGKCKEKNSPEPECTSDEDCGEGRFCNSDGICNDNEPPAPKENCETDEDCVGNEINTICMSNGICGHYVDLGEYCDEYETYCQDGYICMAKCIKELGEGEACIEGDDIQVCSTGLGCYDGNCHAVQENIVAGNECNDTYLKCAEGLTCEEGKCLDYQNEDESCDESNYLVCKSGLICKDAKCTPLGKDCKEQSECTEKDSFCCLDEKCGAKGHCIPYDDIVTHDEMCRFQTKPGIFEAQIQCRWQPPADDELSNSTKVEMPPLVGPFKNNAGLKTVVAFFSYSARANNPTEKQLAGAIRFINPDTCETIETVKYNLMRHAKNMPAAADLDGDGYLEFITFDRDGHTIAFNWDDTNKKHKLMWKNDLVGAVDKNENPTPKNYYPTVFDVNGDGEPEVIVGNTVINGKTGKTIFEGDNLQGQNGAIGILDKDPKGAATLVTNRFIYKWDIENNKWKQLLEWPKDLKLGGYKAYADFGKPGATPEDFNYTELDEKPEIVIAGADKLYLFALITKENGEYDYQTLMDVRGFQTGGPVTIGDFDSDGLPEIGVASKGYFGVYDPRCEKYQAGTCADKHVLWERWSQDASSGATGSSLFDFDGDGQAEAVYADECFTRVYEGKSGKVLFSAKRASGTSYEAPVVADIDGDGSAEILMGSDNEHACADDTGKTYNPAKNGDASNYVDPIHEGIRCEANEDCPKGTGCNTDVGLCTCKTDDDCNTQFAPGKTTILQQYVCTSPIDPNVGMMTNPTNGDARTMVKELGTLPKGWDSTTGYKVCRATRKTVDIGVSDLMIFKDRLDRWVSSRSMWNQHAYNIINIEDNGHTPTPTQWINNWKAKHEVKKIEGTEVPAPLYNNYRLNSQGKYGAGMAPDITGRFIAGSICGVKKDNEGNPVLDENGNEIHVISGKLCNRGTKPVADKLPATFFYYDEDAPGNRGKTICTSYTKDKVDIGECGQVGCQISEEQLEALAGKKVLMVTNLDEFGNASTVECNTENNTDWIEVDKCTSDIVIIN